VVGGPERDPRGLRDSITAVGDEAVDLPRDGLTVAWLLSRTDNGNRGPRSNLRAGNSGKAIDGN